jgi:carbonic anhydrase
VRKEVELLKGSKCIAKEVNISGWIYECETGKVREVV